MDCLPAGSNPERPSRVSLCMIVKNEEANLAACLQPVAKLFDEIIVVDTGSTDRTKECARRFGAKVFDFIWVDSFAAARNESLRHATGHWILWLDADDRLDETNLPKLRRLLAELPEDNSCYMMCQRSTPDQAPAPAAGREVRRATTSRGRVRSVRGRRPGRGAARRSPAASAPPSPIRHSACCPV